MPRHLNYVEPYGGGLAVLLEKDPFDVRHQWGEKGYEQGISEVVNDIYRPLQNFWDVLQGETAFGHFCRMAEATPFSEIEFGRAESRICPIIAKMWRPQSRSLCDAARAVLGVFGILLR